MLIWVSIQWASISDSLNISNINITGNTLISENEYYQLTENIHSQSILSIDPVSLATTIENHSHVKSAKISRKFPNEIMIEITERKPLAILNTKTPLFLDTEGLLIPLRGSFGDYNIPVLSHMIKNDTQISGIRKLTSKSIMTAQYILHYMVKNFPTLYENISELRLNQQEDFEFILLHQPTKVILGKDDLKRKLFVLMRFNNQLILHQKQITDFKKLDLRYDRQVIVQEWT
jgi:cell division protein FtsQ